MVPARAIDIQSHDDGVNAWRTARVAAPPALSNDIYGYSDYWERTDGFTTRRELPHAEGVLIVNLGAPIAITGGDGGVLRLQAGEAFAAGAHLRPALSHSDGTQAGMHVFLPLTTLRRLLGTPMDRLADRVVPLDALLGVEVRDLGAKLCEAKDRHARVALLDAALAHRLSTTAPLASQQRHALHLLRARPNRDISDIARDIGWSGKHLASRVKDAVGIGPRCFRRLLRFQTLTAMIGRHAGAPDWASLALDAGYCDQPHMVREFREFSGMTPSIYRARSLPDGGGLVEA
ncbi:MAG TPA: helix-turn-helix domain-containing protein [Rhizomicrobium sp.]